MAKYAKLERERKYLLRRMPFVVAESKRRIEDHYIAGTTLRLRVVSSAEKAVVYKLTQKLSDVQGTWITSVYLTHQEHDLFSVLPGHRLAKIDIVFPAELMSLSMWSIFRTASA